MKLNTEGIRLEYKTATNELPKDFWPTYSSFANTCGGQIILGVKEPQKGKYEIVGVNNPEKIITDLWNLLSNKSKVSINLLSEDDVIQKNVNGKMLIIINIPEAQYSQKPVYIDGHKDKCYKRTNDGDRQATEDQYKYMIVNSNDDIDNTLLDGYDIDDINLDDLHRYKDVLVQNTDEISYSSMSDTELLINLGAMKRDRRYAEKNYKLTIGGLLFFGKYNSIVDRFPNFQLDYFKKSSSIVTDWDDRISTGDKDFPELNIYSFYTKVLDKLIQGISAKFELNKDLTRSSYQRTLSIAVREALINSLMHAYYDSRQPIKICDYSDYFEFFNPGNMRISKEEYIHGGTSKVRNSTISILFRRAGYAERAGSGGARIFDIAQKLKLKTPEVNSTDESTTIRIWKTDILGTLDKLSEDGKIIVQYLIKNHTINKSAALTKLRMTEYRLRKALSELLMEDVIITRGNGRSTKYSLNRSEELGIYANKQMLRTLEDLLSK